ncbi:MAG: alpha/beta hydrolase [bacterium]
MNFIFPGADRPLETPRFGEAQKIKAPSGREIYFIANLVTAPAKAKAVVLYFHGNGEVVEDLDYVVPFFEKAGWHSFFVEYPGYGHAPGTPSERELGATALGAYDWAKKQYPTLPIIVAGWSLGSAVAAKLAVEREANHLLLLSAMTSMREVVLRLYPSAPATLLEGNEFDTARFIKKLRAAVTILHGEKDDLVPFMMGKELKTLLGQRARFVPIPGAGHNDFYLRGASILEEEILRIAYSL